MRVAVLGLDGLSWAYLEKMVNSGSVHLKSMLNKSSKYVLDAYPPFTPPSWSSIMTGVNPGKHGVFGFAYMDRRRWRQRLYTSLDLEHPRVHEMLSMLGVSSVMINPIPRYPLIRVRGSIIVSQKGLSAPKTVWHPKHLERYVKPLTEPHDIRTFAGFVDMSNALLELIENLVYCWVEAFLGHSAFS